ncbi:c-type cytochrome [Anaeromyxobacter paludicola]|uniref:Cytochrome c n=1 Tax=Anaeromyxobacter paludicola TaxID=2918171 RepID=A0ABN6NC36_9BACT|nr:c-type cytochrome [Anaeromyxobacter paludicola]BDG10823.1 cytochrome c [Anaeromyxobacter paludicola]
MRPPTSPAARRGPGARPGLLALLAAAGLLAPAAAGARPAAPAPASPGAGERIYREGLLPSGRPVRGAREGGGGVEGALAACATCHRRSGLGSWEGQTVIPPILGRYLFRPGARNVDDLDLPHVQGYVARRGAYTDATLARAIREGKDREGRPLGYLMPRYALDDASMASLIAYLKQLGAAPEPGVTRDTLHFATIVTPDADPVARQGMLDVLRQFFHDKNAGYRGATPPMQSSRGIMYRVNRKWQLHVWELSGSPDSWEAQLHERLAAEPVLAVISGLGGRTWAPVHRFCERAALPCLLPNVDLPVVAEGDFYPVYFSKGVLLEAALLSRELAREQERAAVRRLVQVVRPGDVGEEAAAALAKAAPPGLASVTRTVGAGEPRAALAAALTGLGPGDAVVLWLRPGDVAALPADPGPVAAVYASGRMGGLERAPLPPAWRARARLAYPFDLPEERRVRMSFPLGWFQVRRLPVVAERVQTDTWLACAILSETLGHMLDSFVRDYLVERMEALLSHRLVNGYYPRLGLAPGQRFASKGGQVVRFAQGAGTRVVSEGGWAVP